MVDPPAPPTASKPAPRPGSGCLLLLIGLPIVMILGVVVGTVLSRDDEPPEEERVAIERGTIGDVEWQVDAASDVDGDTCAFLVADGEEVTGGCGPEPQSATIGDRTILFGVAAEDGGTVEVTLRDGTTVEVDTVTAAGVPGTFYVTVVDGEVEVVSGAVPSG